jgi:F-type H+-transporting ATPase subunit delta
VKKRLLDTTPYESFRIQYRVDAGLIGGMVIQIGDRVVDSSIRTKLGNMAKDLSKIQLAR